MKTQMKKTIRKGELKELRKKMVKNMNNKMLKLETY